MVPYFPQPEYRLFGPVTVHAFGVLVALSVIVGLRMAVVRCRRKGFNDDICRGLLAYVVLPGFVFAHLFAVVAYFPRQAMENPLLLLKVWENISSFGGFAGGLLGLWLYFRFKARSIDAGERRILLDVIAFVLPFAWTIGRLGCTVAHDHPGTVTTFPLGFSLISPEARAFVTASYRDAGRLAELPPPVELSKMAFHDLGWYEFLYSLLVMVPVFLVADRSPRPPGYFAVAFVLLYAPVRFFLDFLRLVDARYYGLTPGQHAGLAVFLAVSLLAARAARRNARIRRARGM